MKKTVQIEINDNKDLTPEELDNKVMLLGMEFFKAYEKSDFKVGLNIFVELVDILEIVDSKKRG